MSEDGCCKSSCCSKSSVKTPNTLKQRSSSRQEYHALEKVETLQHEGWSELPEKPRWCTDILFLLLLIAAWVCMTIVGLIATGVIQDDRLPAGNPDRLLSAIDYNGNICGFDSSVKDLPNAYYLPDTSVVCVAECPRQNDFRAFICHYDIQAEADSDITQAWKFVTLGRCMYEIDTIELFRRCIPNVDVDEAFQAAELSALLTADTTLSNSAIYALGKANEGAEFLNNFFSSVYGLRAYIGGFGFGLSVVVSFAYLYFIRIPGLLFLTIWSAIGTIGAALVLGTILAWTTAKEWRNDVDRSDGDVLTMQIVSYIGLGLSILYTAVIMVMAKRIMLGIGIVKQTARALCKMPAILFLPLAQALGFVCFLVMWIYFMLYLASSGEITQQNFITDDDELDIPLSYRTFEYSSNTQTAFWYMLFIFFWTYEFVIAFGQLVVALSFACWYFSRDKAKNVGNVTLCWSFFAALRYHLGTIAYGSLVIAIVKTIRTAIAYLQKHAKKKGNKVVEYILCAVQCCCLCIEKCIKFLNKHAYILTAIYGFGMCKAARRAFFLLLRNVLRVSAVNVISGFVLFLGRIVTPLVTTFVCYLAVIYTADVSEVYNITVPLLFVLLISYCVAVMFAELFAMGVETVLFCYIADEEMFKPSNRFADDELRSEIKTKRAVEKSEHKGCCCGICSCLFGYFCCCCNAFCLACCPCCCKPHSNANTEPSN